MASFQDLVNSYSQKLSGAVQGLSNSLKPVTTNALKTVGNSFKPVNILKGAIPGAGAYSNVMNTIKTTPQLQNQLANVTNSMINFKVPKVDIQPVIQRGIDKNQTGLKRRINTTLNSIVSPMANSVLNLPSTAAETLKNISAYSGKAAGGIGYNTKDVLADVFSPGLSTLVNAYGMKLAPAGVSNLATQGTKKSLVKSVIEGAKSGGAYGLLQGFADQLPQNRNADNPEQQIVRSYLDSVPSALMGATLGGVTGAASYGIGKLVKHEPLVLTQDANGNFRNKATGEYYKGNQLVKEQNGSISLSTPKKTYNFIPDPTNPSRLLRDPADLAPFGATVKPLTKAEHNANIAQSTLSDIRSKIKDQFGELIKKGRAKIGENKFTEENLKPLNSLYEKFGKIPNEYEWNQYIVKKYSLKSPYDWYKPDYQDFLDKSNLDGVYNALKPEMGTGNWNITKDGTDVRAAGITLKDIYEENYGKISPKELPSQLPSPQSTLQNMTPTKLTQTPQLGMQQGITPPSSIAGQLPSVSPIQQPGQQIAQTISKDSLKEQPLDTIIAEGRKQIGKTKEPEGKSMRQIFSDAYTQWVDRYNPIVKASEQAKKTLKTHGATLRPEYDPEYLVRRLTGAGGIADARFRNELEPVIKQLDTLKIPKNDMDVYLANKRLAGFGAAGRDIYGADPAKAQTIVSALETKYGQGIKDIADKLYQYQDKGFQEMIDAGFISPENAQLIRQQNPDYAPLQRVMDEVNDYLGLPTRKTMVGTQPIQKIKGSTKQILSPIESIMGNTFSQRAAIEKNRVAKSIVGLQQIAPDLGFTPAAKSSDSTITVWNNGKKEYWNVGKDIAEVAKGTNEEAMNLVLKIIQAPASLLRQGATGRNPEFMLPNIIRDQLDAGVASKYGYIPFIDYVSGLRSMMKNDDVYKAWERSGAKIDLGEMTGKKSITQYFDEKKAKKSLFSFLGNTLDIMGKYSEQPTRVGLFKKAYQKTGNELISAMESRDATVDFARMGSKMKVANSIIPFLNVGVQGFDKLIRSVKNNPGKVLLNASIYGVAPAIATTMYNLTNYPKEYAEVPQYEKDSNFVLVKGRNADGTVDYVTFPKGNIIPTIANPVQSLLEYAAGSSQQTLGQEATSLISSTLPVVGDGSTLKEVAIKTVGSNIPQAIKPLAENLLNKSFYKYDPNKEQTKDIVPYYLQNRPSYKQDYQFTPLMYKKIGAVLNVSPLKAQNLMEGYLAGYSKVPAQLVEMLSKVSRGQTISPNEKTLIRRFVKQTYPGSAAKPQAPAVQSPGLMERVTGKAKAAESTMTPDQEKYAIEDMKYQMKSKNTPVSKVGNKVLITQSNGDIKTIDTSKKIDIPKLTGSAEIDKLKISKVNGAISSKSYDILSLYDAGQITEEEAVAQLKQLKSIKDSFSTISKSYKKSTGTKKLKKLKAISVKIPKMKKIKVKSLKLKQPKAAKLKISKMKSIKLAKG